MTSPSSPEQGTAGAGRSHPADEFGGSCLVAVGRRLRQAREAQGLATTVLAARLHIGVEQLESLESANRERLPEPVFVIAQARRVAAALHLDITSELQALRTSGELESQEPPAPQSSSRAGQTSASVPVKVNATPRLAGGHAAETPRPQWRPPGAYLLLGGGLLLALAAVWGVSRLQMQGATPPIPKPAQGPSPAVPRSARVPSPAIPRSARGPSPAVPTPVSKVPKAVIPEVVVLASREPSWVEVRRPEGTILFSGLLRGAREFPLDKGIKVFAGRPDLVTSRIGSGPAQRLGSISDVRWRSFATGH